MASDTNSETESTVIRFVTLIAKGISNTVLALVEAEIQKYVKHPSRHKKAIPEIRDIKWKVGICANIFATASAIKRFFSK